MTSEIPRCVAIYDLEKVGRWVRAKVCQREGKPGKPLCAAHMAILEVSPIDIIADDGRVYVIGGVE